MTVKPGVEEAALQNEGGVIMKMRSMYDALAKSEKKVVDYILEHPERVIRLSVTELAADSGVSDATVVRACRKLGMLGYQDLKVSLAQSKVTSVKAINEAITEDDDYIQMIQKVFASSIQTLNQTLSVLNFTDVKSAADLIFSAGRTVIMALGNSSSLAMDLYHKLLRLGLDVSVCTDAHIQMIIACGAEVGAVLVAVSHSGSSKDIIEAAKCWKEGGGKVVTMTNIGISPLSKLADIALVTASRETMFKLSALSSRAAAMALIDSIYTLIAMSNREEVMKRFMQIEKNVGIKKI